MLPSSEIWLSSKHFAELVDISRRKATQALCRAIGGRPWRGTNLSVRMVSGRGGKSSERYEVALSSLSVELQSRFWGLSEARPDTCAILAHVSPGAATHTRSNLERVSVEAGASMLVQSLHKHPDLPAVSERRELATNQGAVALSRFAIIETALAAPARSPERAALLAEAARKSGHGKRTLERWIATYEHSGGDLLSLGRKRPANAGQKRVHVSAAFDKAWRARGYAEDRLAEYGALVEQLLKDWWASPAQRSGDKRIRLEVITALKRQCEADGIELPRTAYAISIRRVQSLSRFREVDVYRHDHKRWQDGKSRIRRDNTKWAPLQQVVLDVKTIDVELTRPDGSRMQPKMIGFFDSGTQRMFVHFVFPVKGEGIRQEHVIRAFLEMVAHPEWGLPSRIYMDNGSENLRLEMIQPLLDMIAEAGLKTIVKAKPYNAAAKPIESRFSVFDRHIFNQMEGYVGGDRQNRKTHQHGKRVRPFPGSYEAFEAEARLRIEDLERQPIGSGPQAGVSPHEAFSASVDRGWLPVTVDEHALDATFCERIVRRVDRGAVAIGGTRYRRDDLPNGRNVTVALSYRRGAAPLVYLPGTGWAYLEEEQLHTPWLETGAIDAARYQSADKKRVADMRKQTRKTDQRGNIEHRLKSTEPVRLPTAAARAPLMEVLASQQAQEMAAARIEGEQRRLSAPDAEQERVARQNAETEAWEKYLASKRA